MLKTSFSISMGLVIALPNSEKANILDLDKFYSLLSIFDCFQMEKMKNPPHEKRGRGITYINKSETPIRDIMAPKISLGTTFSLSMIIEIGIISIGVIDMIVETMPVGAC